MRQHGFSNPVEPCFPKIGSKRIEIRGAHETIKMTSRVRERLHGSRPHHSHRATIYGSEIHGNRRSVVDSS